MKSKIGFFLLVVMMTMMWSCRSKRSIYKAPIKNEGPEYLMKQMETHELKYQTLSAKFSLHYAQGKEKTSFKGNIRIKKDSLVWMSIAPVMGIEIARIMFTPDSVKVIDRTRKHYLAEEYDFVNQYLNNTLDFDMLQALLIGNDFGFYEEASWKTSIEGGLYKLATANRQKLKKYIRENQAQEIPIQNTWLDPQSFKIKKMMIKEVRQQRNRKLTAEYDNYYVIDSQRVPLHAEYRVRADDNISIMLDYSRVRIDNSLKFPFHISDKYEKVIYQNK